MTLLSGDSPVVRVAVMDVRIMFMRMNKSLVRVFMTVRLFGTFLSRMLMLMVLIVYVPMGVRDRLVHVEMLVSLGEMEP